MGQNFAWRRAHACPCVNPNSGQAKPNCPYCLGKGRYWDDPVVGAAGIVGRDQMQQFAQFGIWDAGDIMLSIPSDSPLYAIGPFDRVAALNRSEPFSIAFVRGVNDVIRFPVIGIESVSWFDGTRLVTATDVTAQADGTLVFASDKPAQGTTYSVTGRRTPEFFVYQELPADRPMHYGQPLPRRVVLRRFDLYGR